MIKKGNELNFADKKMSLIIQGSPGVGKTTIAQSAPKVLTIDADNDNVYVGSRFEGLLKLADKGLTVIPLTDNLLYDNTMSLSSGCLDETLVRSMAFKNTILTREIISLNPCRRPRRQRLIVMATSGYSGPGFLPTPVSWKSPRRARKPT